MTGLEKILKHIEEDAAATAGSVIREAKDKAEELVASAKEEAQKKCIDIALQSKINVEASLSRAESAALLQEKKLILNTKQQIISDFIASAKESLIKLSDEEYFKVIIKMVQKYALAKPGQILFSDADKGRMPKQFEETLSAALSEKKGAALMVSEETRDLGGGFVLIYGDVEENCSFDALFFAAAESLQDKVCELLFE
jgi:V/A-type H+-transporting ATPase subunit E